MDAREVLRILDSATKYPSIETFHKIGEKGRLVNELTDSGTNLMLFSGVVTFTEKIDGLNTRVLHFDWESMVAGIYNQDWFIGSREVLLASRGDRVTNSAHGIVEHLQKDTECLFGLQVADASLVVIYREIYGGNLTKSSRHYAHDGLVGNRVFDVQLFSHDDLEKILAMPIEKVSALREHGKLPGRWMNDYELERFCETGGLTRVPVLPPATPGNPPPDFREAYDWLSCQIARTKAVLGSGDGGNAEGVVVRTPDRRAIVKLRFEDYGRTFRK